MALKSAWVDHPDRMAIISSLGQCLAEEHQHDRDVTKLHQAIGYLQQSLDLWGSRQRPLGTLSTLAMSLEARYHCMANMADLNRAIGLYQECLDRCTTKVASWHREHRHRLAGCLKVRYIREGRLVDLDEACRLIQEGLAYFPAKDPCRCFLLTSWGDCLALRYHQGGDPSDLAEAIRLHQQSLQLCPPGYLTPEMVLENLAECLATHSELSESVDSQAELDEACRLLKQSLSYRDTEHPQRCSTLSILASCYRMRFRRQADMTDLTEAIRLQRECLELCPSTNPNRDVLLSNLSDSLLARYDQVQDTKDLSEAITLQWESLHLCPPGNRYYAARLVALSRSLLVEPVDAVEPIRDTSQTGYYRQVLVT